jgi:hypothetical protein
MDTGNDIKQLAQACTGLGTLSQRKGNVRVQTQATLRHLRRTVYPPSPNKSTFAVN